jgi:hypothetical protein
MATSVAAAFYLASACYAEHFIQVVREHKVLNLKSQ